MTDEMVMEKSDDDLAVTNLLILRQMAESIRIAHEINPTSWSVYKVGNEIVFNISIYYMLTTINLQRMDFSLMVDLSIKDRGILGYKSVDTPASFPGVRLRMPIKVGQEYLGTLSESHEEAVRLACALVKTKPHFWQRHDAALVEEVGKAIGESLPRPSYLDPPAGKRFWKISAGVAGREWSNFQHRSVIALDCEGKGSVADLPEDRSSFVRALIERDSLSSKDANSLWTFAREIKLNDQVVNTSSLILRGIGRVVGEYEYVIDDFSYPHRRRVHWKDHEPAELNYIDDSTRAYLSRRASILPLTEDQFSIITRTEAGGNRLFAEPAPTRTVSELLQGSFSSVGLFYTPLQLTTFYTALQTKGFVVLSGISGTGKSKIAQHFASMLPLPKATVQLMDRDDLIRVKVHPYSKKNGYLALPKKQIEKFPVPLPSETVSVNVRFGDVSSEGRLAHIVFGDAPSQLVRLTLSDEVKKRFQTLDLDQVVYFEPEVGAEDRISAFNILLPDEVIATASPVPSTAISSHLFLSVRPDWRDSRALIGYYNPLLNQYEWIDFLRFILRASESFEAGDPTAWFVILDEMNLAHVEYYFADLLSILESGRDADGWTREAIRITVPELEDDEDSPPSEIRLPPNLYIIGTVNMDETTHAFSPKVLDRAFTLELSDVDFSHYPPVSEGVGNELTGAESSQILRAFTRGGRFARIDKFEISDIVAEYPNIRVWLQSLNVLLAKSRMNFGYRVFDEIAQFVANAEANDGFASFESFQCAFDSAVLMKVLPKFSGSAARLERPLLDLLAWCVDSVRLPQEEIRDAQDGLDDRDWLDSSFAKPGELYFPITGKRVMRMLDALATEGFASFG